VGRGAGVWYDREWPAASQGEGCSQAAAGRDDQMRRTDGGQGRGRDAPAGRHWDAEPQHDGGGYPTGVAGAAGGSHRDAPAGRHWDTEPQHDGGGYPTGGAGAAGGSHRDAHAGRHWDAEPQHDGGGYPTAGAGAAAGLQCDVRNGRHWGSEPLRDGGEYPADASGTGTGVPRSACWDAGPDNDGPAAALLKLGIVGPAATPDSGAARCRLRLGALLVVGASRSDDSHGVAGLAYVRESRSPLRARRGREPGRGGPPAAHRRSGGGRPHRARRRHDALPTDPADSGEAVPCRLAPCPP